MENKSIHIIMVRCTTLGTRLIIVCSMRPDGGAQLSMDLVLSESSLYFTATLLERVAFLLGLVGMLAQSMSKNTMNGCVGSSNGSHLINVDAVSKHGDEEIPLAGNCNHCIRGPSVRLDHLNMH